MPLSTESMKILFLLPVAALVIYYDVRYRRIPNLIVIATLVAGLVLNSALDSWHGVLGSAEGFALAFTPMFLMHVFGAMGAGDVKLFAAICSLMGAHLVLPTFLIVAVTGGVLGILVMIRARQLKFTLMRVLQILIGLLPGYKIPKFPVPADRRHTIPYGVAITFGSFISLVIFRP